MEKILPLPLAGLRVLAVEQLGAGPFGTMQLADMGAEVIKIEDPTVNGDSARSVGPFLNESAEHDSLYFQSLNRNKKSFTLNLREPRGQEILHRLAEGADVVFNNLRGDLPDRLGLTYEHLRSANPTLVTVSCSGYGTGHEMASEPAYDYLVQGRIGMMSLTGEPGAPPTKSGLSVIDFTAGLLAMIGLLAGVQAAKRDGVGRDVDVSLYGAGLSLLNYVAAWTLNAEYWPAKLDRSQHPSLVPAGLFRTSDGWLMVMCMKPKFFERLCIELGCPELIDDERFRDAGARRSHRDELNSILDGFFAREPTAEWIRRLAGKVPCGPVLDVEEALDDDLVREIDMLWTVEHAEFGPLEEMACPIKMTAGHRDMQVRAPYLGEHSDEILAELGYAGEDIDELRARSVI